MVSNPGASKIFRSQISVKVNLYDHLVVEFVQCIHVGCMCINSNDCKSCRCALNMSISFYK